MPTTRAANTNGQHTRPSRPSAKRTPPKSQVLDRLLGVLEAEDATDLHLQVDSQPRMRVNGMIRPIDGERPMTLDAVRQAIAEATGTGDLSRLDQDRQVDFAFTWLDRARLRGNAYYQRGMPSLALRRIPMRIPTLEQVGAPTVVADIMRKPHGLVLVTGPTGAGKSTTLASMIGAVNASRHCHILTIEDPIEYLHSNELSVVNQREVGVDCADWHMGLRAALREDPDVLLIGEMRDLESIQAALTIAETGHLVLATLHTNDTSQAIDRIVDVFPAGRREQVQVQLAATLLAVVYQRLMPALDGGMVAAFEVLLGTSAARTLVREGKTGQLRNVVSTNRAAGMQTLEHHLSDLVAAGRVSLDDARGLSGYPKEVQAPAAAASAAPKRR